ncbi:Mod(Mdg4), partial [Operophtera brumata]
QAHFTTSRYGNPVLLLGGFRYNKKAGVGAAKGPRARWVCVKVGDGCRAAIRTYYDEIIELKQQHNHL